MKNLFKYIQYRLQGRRLKTLTIPKHWTEYEHLLVGQPVKYFNPHNCKTLYGYIVGIRAYDANHPNLIMFHIRCGKERYLKYFVNVLLTKQRLKELPPFGSLIS